MTGVALIVNTTRTNEMRMEKEKGAQKNWKQ